MGQLFSISLRRTHSVLIGLVVSVFICACKEPVIEDSSAILNIPDSIKAKDVFAVYKDEYGVSVIVGLSQTTKKAIRYACFSNGQVLTDSLLIIGKDSYYSPAFRSTYVVTTQEVKRFDSQKTVHPSSNWQGQTPGKYYSSSTYKRIQ
jgi:hypothetical protein